MLFLSEKVEKKVVIEKSNFIAILNPISSVDEIPGILKLIKKEYPKATHYCTAYVLENSQGSNDDGEPAGTAGVPILEMLNTFNLTNTYAVVVRYYGGIKLGTGGLIRAYAGVTKEAILESTLLKEIETTNYRVTFDYKIIDQVDQLFKNNIQDKSFSDEVTYYLSFKEDEDILSNHQHMFLNIKNNGTKKILVPWK